MPYFIAAGEKLIEAKATCNHGEFQNWIKRNFNVTHETARVWMIAARKSQNPSALGFSSLRQAIKTEPKKIEISDEIIDAAEDNDFDRDAWVEKIRRKDEYRMAEKEEFGKTRELANQIITADFTAGNRRR